jgi:glycosyltransferase involved in cell wall biosynthesis
VHPRTLRRLRKEARRADAVIAHGSTTLWACAAVRLVSGTPFAYRQISDSTFWAPTRARRLRVRAGLRLAARVVALWSGSAATLHRQFGVDDAKVRVIPNGVPADRVAPVDRLAAPTTRRTLGLQPAAPTVLSLGALVPEKGVDLTIRAVGGLRGVQLLVVGDGPQRAHLERLAASVAPGRVVFTGSVADPNTAFTAADVVSLPSRGGDSMPAVLIEAGLAGLPVVSTPIQGIVDIVEPGVTGALVTPDSVEELRIELDRVLGDPALAARRGDAARERCIEHFTIDAVGAAWARVVDELVAP